MSRSAQTQRPPKVNGPAISDEQRAETQRLAAWLWQAQRGAWDEALLWRYTTDAEFRALCALYAVQPPATEEGGPA